MSCILMVQFTGHEEKMARKPSWNPSGTCTYTTVSRRADRGLETSLSDSESVSEWKSGHPYSIQNELSLICWDVSLGISSQHASATDSNWLTWESFCTTINIDPTLQEVEDLILPIQLFPHHYHWGDISPSKAAVCGRTVGNANCAIRQMLANMGVNDPRLLPSGKLNFRLSRQLSSYKNRIHPCPELNQYQSQSYSTQLTYYTSQSPMIVHYCQHAHPGLLLPFMPRGICTIE